VSTWLLDVNALLGCAWRNHADHTAIFNWLARVGDWATCPLTESGFVRISMTPAYQALFEDARKSLATLRALPGHRFMADTVDAASLPLITSYKDTTDAHLVTLAKRHGMKLATLDLSLIAKPWATGIAENSIQTATPAPSQPAGN
jgi:toxin-antitoxin system PIN domain toxin